MKNSKMYLVLKALFLSFLLMNGILWSQQNIHKSEIKELVGKDSDRLKETYKDLHRNPEIAHNEFRTAGIIAKELKALGYEVITGIAKTGVVGILRNGEGPVVMYRADMDCNGVLEVTGLPYASDKTFEMPDGSTLPLMHACGHDAHVTWMLGAAKILAGMKDKWKGTLVFLGQPAEEDGTGAQEMIKDGLYEKGCPIPDYYLGFHTAPLPTGMVAGKPGRWQAGMDQIDVIFKGIGGHGSMPNYTKDPVIMSAMAVIEYQSIISRGIDPQNSAVLTVGSIQAGTDNNVIPSDALVKINLRWFENADRELMVKGIERINRSIAYAYNMPEDMYPEMIRKGWASTLVNDSMMAGKIISVLNDLLGEKNVMTDMNPLMGSEDFQHIVNENENHKYCYMMIGIAPPEMFQKAGGFPFTNHNGNFQVDLNAIPLGTEIAANSILEFFNK